MRGLLRIALGCLPIACFPLSCRVPIPTEGLQLWLKADAGVIVSGSTVSLWADQSGQGNDAIQTEVQRQPLFLSHGLNGLPVLRFDGADDRLALTGTSVMSRLSFFIVVKIDSGATGPNPYYPLTLGDMDATGKVLVLGMQVYPLHDAQDVLFLATGLNVGVRADAANCAAFGRWNCLSVTADQTMWSTTVRVNGVDASIVRFEPNILLSISLGSPGGTGVGGLGGSDGVPIPPGRAVAKCDIAEVIVYDTVVPDSVRRSIERYLETKYRLPLLENK